MEFPINNIEKGDNMSDIKRKLASIRTISETKPIQDADLIEVAVVDGWELVIRKGEFQPGDVAVYIECDAWVPHNLAPFLSKGGEPREYGGVLGNRVRTVKLRGQVSQGLLMPLSVLGDVSVELGDDVSEQLNIQKWEAPIPAQLSGQVSGSFPSFIPKTDEHRVQNMVEKVTVTWADMQFEVTLKLDGSSATVFFNDGEVGYCGRNWQFSDSEDNSGNSIIAVAKSSGLSDALVRYGKNIALQGEIMGPGVQSNREKLTKHALYIFNVYDIDNQRYYTASERHELLKNLDVSDAIQSVPVIGYHTPREFGGVRELLEFADRKSITHPIAEGVVWKSLTDPHISFKVINNRFLLKEK